jgi:hypothetical protein
VRGRYPLKIDDRFHHAMMASRWRLTGTEQPRRGAWWSIRTVLLG